MKGREGIPVQLGITLFKTLVRSHLEYAIPAWAAIADKEVIRLEKVQSNCLSMIIGAKANSSVAAMEVITGVIPFRIRIRELCMREFCRIMSKDKDHVLRKLVDQSTRRGLQFCPVEYMRIVSKQLISIIGECQIVNDRVYSWSSQSTSSDNVSRLDIIPLGSGEACVVKEFVSKITGKSVLLFTDGSVRCREERTVGPGACAAVMFPLQGDGVESLFTKAVGKNIYIVSCEVEGIILGLEKVVEYFSVTIYREVEVLYILCDCDRAIEYVLEKNPVRSCSLKRRFDQHVTQLQQAKVKVVLVWIPSHSDINGNEMADTLANRWQKKSRQIKLQHLIQSS